MKCQGERVHGFTLPGCTASLIGADVYIWTCNMCWHTRPLNNGKPLPFPHHTIYCLASQPLIILATIASHIQSVCVWAWDTLTHRGVCMEQLEASEMRDGESEGADHSFPRRGSTPVWVEAVYISLFAPLLEAAHSKALRTCHHI